MSVSHASTENPTVNKMWSALQALPERVSALLKTYESSNEASFEDFEGQLRTVFADTECAVTEEALARQDVDLPFMHIDGEVHRRACRCEKTYLSAAGPVTVMRTLYRAQRGERAVAALEREVGMVEGYWTPLAARQAALLVSHLTPREAEEVLHELGPMQPSRSSLDRLPKALSARWEAQREEFETQVREASVEVPQAARAVVVSLDGVMAPMRGGYREAGCATLSLVDGQGERLHSVRMGRMPEPNKATLKTMVAAELEAVLAQRPDLKLVKLADGAKDNWTFFSRALPEGIELIDFFHAAEQLHDAFDAAYGADSPKAAAQFEKYRHLLRHEPNGVERVIRALVYLRSTHPGRNRIARVLGYFRRHRHRMRYAQAKAQGLPIGSGVVEAACKTLVTERLKRSGMRWTRQGGQAILTLRSLVQSQRFEWGWTLLSQSYRATVASPTNVVPLRRANVH